MTNIDIEKFNSDYNDLLTEERLGGLPEHIRAQVAMVLEYEKSEEYEKAKKSCKEILEKNAEEELEQVKIILARIYPKLLRTDVESGNQKYKVDEREYLDFLETMNMNSLMQEHLADTIMKLGELMENKWYRPIFAEFIADIDKKGYMSDEKYHKIIDSAYCSMESYSYFEDVKVSMIVKNLLKAYYQKIFVMPEEKIEAFRNSMMIETLTNEWYTCKYIAGKEEELEYIKERYPHSYKMIDSVITDKNSDKAAKSEEILQELMNYVAVGVDMDKLRETMEKSYEDMVEKIDKNLGKAAVVHSGNSSYKRKEIKVGRNDLCPCGSGKKYKYCCGK